MNTIKIAVIGLGNIGIFHAKHITSGNVAGMSLAAVCARSGAKAQWVKEN